MLNQECKICGKEFHWCSSCDMGFDFDMYCRSKGYCNKFCRVMSFIDEDDEDLLMAYEVIKDLMNENLELQARLSIYEKI